MSRKADRMSGSGGAQTDIDVWVAQQLAAFAPLGPGELVALAAILDYDADRSSDKAA
jgi:hypothetical protein